MVWLNATDVNGSSLYFDLFRVEQRRGGDGRQLALTGTLGDGLFEGQVLVEVGGGVEITFVDEWLNRSALEGLFQRTARHEVEAALVEAVLGLVRGFVRPARATGTMRSDGAEPHGRWETQSPHSPQADPTPWPLGVAESGAVWRASV